MVDLVDLPRAVDLEELARGPAVDLQRAEEHQLAERSGVIRSDHVDWNNHSGREKPRRGPK
jgi:hypothetical protein